MKKYSWLLFFLLFSITYSYSSIIPENSYLKGKKKKEKSSLIIKKKKGRYGVVDKKEQKIILPIVYDKIKPINQDGFIAQKDDKWVIYNEEGQLISSKYYLDKVHIPDESTNQNKIVAIGKPNKKLEAVIIFVKKDNDYFSYKYDKILSISPTYYHIEKNGLYGTFSLNGEEIIPPLYKTIEYLRPSKKEDPYLAKVYSNSNYVGFINVVTGEIIVSVIWDEVIPLGGSIFKVKKGHRWGLVNNKNEEILPVTYQNIIALSPQLIKVEDEEGQIFYVSIDSSRGLEEDYLATSNFLKIEQKKMKFGLLREDGSMVIPFQYDHIEKTPQGVFIVTKGKKSKLIDVEGKELTPNYKSIEYNELTQNFLAQDSKKRWNIINYKGEVLLQTKITKKKKLLEFLNERIEEEPIENVAMKEGRNRDRSGWVGGVLAGIGTAFVYLAYALGYVAVILVNVSYF